ncbi:MAG: Lrp/AsnC ligand binding domain-containing protein [Steroidobacteraceae bacterium]|nr:Lrp/AsnC ligand binding domain-containing protein [Steroidobacteraceae bacterium]
MAGDADFLLQVVPADLDAYAEFALNVVRRLPRIREMQTTFVLK